MESFGNFKVYKNNCGCEDNCPKPFNGEYYNLNYIFDVLGLNEKVGNYVCNIFSSNCRKPIISDHGIYYYNLEEKSKLNIQQLIGKEVRVLRRIVDPETNQKMNDQYHIPLTKIEDVIFLNNIQEYRFLVIKVESDHTPINPSRIVLPISDL